MTKDLYLKAVGGGGSISSCCCCCSSSSSNGHAENVAMITKSFYELPAVSASV
jgi:hypothetical protein